jgi:hypothetical protein
MGVATLIRSHIDAIEEEEERPNAMGDSDKPTNFGNVQFGARQKPCLFAELEEQTSSDPLYSNLRKKLSVLLHNGGFELHDNQPSFFLPEDQVRFIQ